MPSLISRFIIASPPSCDFIFLLSRCFFKNLALQNTKLGSLKHQTLINTRPQWKSQVCCPLNYTASSLTLQAPPQNDHHPALEVNQDQPPTYNNRDFSSPLAQPPLTNPGSPPPAHLHNPNDFPPQSQGQPPHGQPPQQNLNSVPLQSLQSQSAPVVCPSCGVRDFTVTTAEAGGFTQ